MKWWEEIIRVNVFGIGGNQDHLPACLTHMLYCIVTEKPYNLAYFIAKRIEFLWSQPKLNLPYGTLLIRLFNHVMEPQKIRKDVGIKRSRHSTSSSSAFHYGSSSHQNDDDEELHDEATSRNSTPSPRSYYNSLSPI
nr:pentatricopeptide repeat-containing protein [Tanacetum cinerariifolium]GEZ19445.1 pentatricopeptide repeat-containing protein [Tanacetum cinerariifolium]